MIAFPVRAAKALAVARKRGDSNFVRTCLQTISMMELNQKLTKHSQKMLNTGRLHRGNIAYLCKNLGFKEGGGCLLEGGVFSGIYGITSNEIVGNIYKVNRGRRCAFFNVQEHQIVQMLPRHR